jgi:hypothetical protein
MVVLGQLGAGVDLDDGQCQLLSVDGAREIAVCEELRPKRLQVAKALMRSRLAQPLG